MPPENNKRPPRQPLSPEEVQEIIKIKKLKQQIKTEKFKQTRSYKYLNVFNVICITVYTEIIFAFLYSCAYQTYTIDSIATYYGESIVGNKRELSSIVFKTTNGKEYDIGVRDTVNLPKVNDKLSVGRDWILQKEIKVKWQGSTKAYYIKRAFPLLFISILLGIVTFVLFGYNLNQNSYSLNVISFINTLSILSFFLL